MLPQSARIGKLDPVIGRDDEIRRCVHILSRRTKNNPVLIGESGVGKTAIVEGLAQVMSRTALYRPALPCFAARSLGLDGQLEVLVFR